MTTADLMLRGTPWGAPRIFVYDGYLRPQYPLLDFETLDVKRDINALGVAEFTIRADHVRRSDLMIGGRRVVIRDPYGRILLSGPIKRVGGSSPARSSKETIQVEDDACALFNHLGWVNPLMGPEAQSIDDSDAAWKLTASAEAAFKELVSVNFDRWGLAHRVVPSLGRGAQVTLRSRMDKLSDVIFPTCTQAGILPFVQQRPTETDRTIHEIIVDCSVPTVRLPILTVRSPQVTSWSYEVLAPTAVGGVAGGAGQGNARTFVAWQDQSIRSAYGPYWTGELFDDHRQESRRDSLTKALQDSVKSQGPSTSMDIALADTPDWAYGTAWVLGDFLRFRLVDTAPIQQVQITQSTHTYTPEAGYRVTAKCTPPNNTRTTRQAAFQLARRIRHLETGH